MDNEETKEMTRREFLTWLAGAAVLFALPGSGGRVANAAAPAWAFADLDLPLVDDMPADAVLAFPDPPPPIINPPGVSTPHLSAIAQQHAATPYNHGAYAQYGAYSPQMSQGHHAVPTVYQTPSRSQFEVSAPTAAPEHTERTERVGSMKLSAARRVGPTVQPVQPSVQPAIQPSVQAPGGKVSALSRRLWADTPPNPAKMRLMGQVRRVTIHHEGSEQPNNDSMPFEVVATLRRIQDQHRKRMGAGDIGYHFIIDRTGMIWQGRDWAYQGAHTSGANANNLGVMLLGNFEIQRPTQAQLNSLHRLTASLVRKYGLNPARDIFGHSDFCKTQCPGTNLRPQVDLMRRMSM